jgi:uncharacterized protein (DUF58 family)
LTTSNDYKRYLDPTVVSRLQNLELKAKFVVEGFITGLHKSPYHGFSVEFAQHRQYMPGDDLRHLDWKMIARSDRYYIKQYEEETNLKSYILLDSSKSMDFSSAKVDKGSRILDKFRPPNKENQITKPVTKLEYASYLAASLSYLMIMQNDATSLAVYDTQVRSYIPPSSTKVNLREILRTINSIKPDNKTGTADSLNEIANKIFRRGLVIVISDLFDDQTSVIKALKHFRYKKNEVIVFQILDPLELSFLDGNPVTLVDVETKEELYSQPFVMKNSYRQKVNEFLEIYRRECLNNKIEFVTLTTKTPFDKALLSYLYKRGKLY